MIEVFPVFPSRLIWSKRRTTDGGSQYYVTLDDGTYLVANSDGTWRHLDVNAQGFYTLSEGKALKSSEYMIEVLLAARASAEVFYEQYRQQEVNA